MNYVACRALKIEAGFTMQSGIFSFQKANFTSVTDGGVRHGVAGKHHLVYSMSRPWVSSRRGVLVTQQRGRTVVQTNRNHTWQEDRNEEIRKTGLE